MSHIWQMRIHEEVNAVILVHREYQLSAFICFNKVMPYSTPESQTAHRLNILGKLIVPGTKILEIGCGQGDCTTVLASLIGSGHSDAIDPAPHDYGSPKTLGEAQARILASDIGSRISFHQSGPIDFLKVFRMEVMMWPCSCIPAGTSPRQTS